MKMNLEKYYPCTSIESIEVTDDIVIIHTDSSEKENKNICDLPIFGKKVIIKISKDKTYPWMDTNGNTKRLNDFIASCCKTIKDGHTLEHILTLNGIRLCPPDYNGIYDLALKRHTKINNAKFSCERGQKTSLDYNFICDTIYNLYTVGIPDKTISSLSSGYSLFDETDDYQKNISTHKPTLREIQEYFIENTDIGKLSLSTIYDVSQYVLKSFTPYAHPIEFPLYQETSGNFGQEHVFDYQYHGNYETWFEEYRTLELKPAKINIQGTTYPQILAEIKTKEEFTLTVSAADFYDKYMKWRCDLNTFLRLYPYIGIKNQTFYLSHADYILEREDFHPLPPENRYAITPLSSIRPDAEIHKFIYKGKCDFDMMNYIERGAVFNLEIPKEGTIEIGIGDCLRISTPNDNYLIPFLEITKHII